MLHILINLLGFLQFSQDQTCFGRHTYISYCRLIDVDLITLCNLRHTENTNLERFDLIELPAKLLACDYFLCSNKCNINYKYRSSTRRSVYILLTACITLFYRKIFLIETQPLPKLK